MIGVPVLGGRRASAVAQLTDGNATARFFNSVSWTVISPARSADFAQWGYGDGQK